jgi:hypothetical protein
VALANALAGEPFDGNPLRGVERAWGRLERERRLLDAELGTLGAEVTYERAARDRLRRALELARSVVGLRPCRLSAPLRSRLGETCLDVMLDVPHELEAEQEVTSLRRLAERLLPGDPRPGLAEQARDALKALIRDPLTSPVQEVPDLAAYGRRWTCLGQAMLASQRARSTQLAREGIVFDPLAAGLRGIVELSLYQKAARRLASRYEELVREGLDPASPAPAPVLLTRWERFEANARSALTLNQAGLFDQNGADEKLFRSLARALLYAGKGEEARRLLEAMPPQRNQGRVDLLLAEALLLEGKLRDADARLDQAPQMMEVSGTRTAIELAKGKTDQAIYMAKLLELPKPSRDWLAWRAPECTQRLLAGEPDARQPLWKALKDAESRR